MISTHRSSGGCSGPAIRTCHPAPWHSLLESWARTWIVVPKMRDGPRIKKAFDEALPKGQAIIARKPMA